jgi:hypothetical protein
MSSRIRALKAGSSEVLIKMYQTTQRHISEDRNLHSHVRENLKTNSKYWTLYKIKLLITGCLKMQYTLVIWLVYSCCSHLEHRTSVKHFISLQFLNLRHSVGLLGRVISPSQGRYLTQTRNKHKEPSMPRVGFQPTIPAFKRAKTVHALDRAATVMGAIYFHSYTFLNTKI